MESQISAWIQWSLEELKELVDDKDSCVCFERAKRHIALQPLHLNNLNKALHEILSKTIYHYDSELKGLLLSYKNPKLLSSLGSILYDSYFIHVDIEADFYIFRPEIGCTLSGIVNKQATNHIGVLVHKAFHVSIPINDDDDDAWRGHDAYVGQDVKFTVTHLDFKGKLPFIRGKLLSDSIVTHNNNEDSQLESIISKHSHEVVNGDENVDSDDTSNRKYTATKPSKPSKRINFLTSVLNQSSESSSDEEIEPIKKSSKRKVDKAPIEDVKKNKKEKISAIEREDNIASPSKDKYSSNDIENDRDVSEKKVKKKSKNRKKAKSDSESEDEDAKLIVKNENKLQSNEANHEISPVPVSTHDGKPRIIHDRVLNGNERNIKIERQPLTTSKKKKSIFAHDISDSDDDSDDDRKPLTQSTYSIVSDGNHENEGGTYSNGLRNSDAIETEDESEGESAISSGKANKTDGKKMGVIDDDVDTKEHLRNNMFITTSTPERISKLNEDSPKSKIIRTSVNNHVDVKHNVKVGHSDSSADSSSTENDRKMKKKLKKKLKKLTPEKTPETSIEYSSPPRSSKIENGTAAISPNKSHKLHTRSTSSEDESFDFKSPKKIKIRKDETNLFANVKIKREPDASDIESSSSSKIDQKHKSDMMNGTGSFVEVRVKSEPVNVKSEVKTKSEKKRKHREENQNGTRVKCESETSDSDTSFLPKKKIKTIFSE